MFAVYTDKGEGERNSNTLCFLDVEQQHRKNDLSDVGQSGLQYLNGRFVVRSNWHQFRPPSTHEEINI